MAGLIHVGAWHGLEYVDHSGRLLLFEPGDEAFAQLATNMAGRSNVVMIKKAVGSKAGTQTMHMFTPSHSSSLLQPLVKQFSTSVIDQIAYTSTATVEVTTLDREMRNRHGFDVLRIDTQGYELEVLKGATETLKVLKRVELELHDPSTYEGAATLGEIDDFMWSQGWRQVSNDTAGSDGLGDVTYEPSNGG